MKPPIPSPFAEPSNEVAASYPEENGDAICIRYLNTPSQLWRGHWRAFYLMPLNLPILIGGSLMITLAYSHTQGSFWPKFASNLLLILVISETLTWMKIRNKTKSPIGSITCLMREGPLEIEPVAGTQLKVTKLSWSRVVAILEINGSVLFIGWAMLFSVPHEAFCSREEAQRFCELAQRLRKSRGADWPADASALHFGRWPKPTGTA